MKLTNQSRAIGRRMLVSVLVCLTPTLAFGTVEGGAAVERPLGRIADAAPTICAALLRDGGLRQELGDIAYARALNQLAKLCESRNGECRQALEIIGDTVPRLQARVGQIELDGRPGEWQRALPTPESRRWHEPTEDRAREVWKHGIAAVVRDRRLFILAGIDDPAFSDLPGQQLRIRVDCCAGPEWDAYLGIDGSDGRWTGWCDFITPADTPQRDRMVLEGVEVAVGQVVEIGLNIDNFAPPESAKPIWTLYLKARTVDSGKMYHPRTGELPVFNESAAEGVAAGPYVRNLMYLAADVGLERNDRIACAIAIAAATIDATSDSDVRRQLRRDNAELLRFAREIIADQRRNETEFRLDHCPLEAQIAWANRCIWLGVKYLGWNRGREAPGDLEDYRWAYTDIETLRRLRKVAEQEGLLASEAGETARRINRWVSGKLKRRPWIGHVERELKRAENDPKKAAELRREYEQLRELRESGRATVGQFKNQPVYQVFARNTGVYLREIERNGCFWGGCPDEAWIEQDLLRAAGLAPLAMSVSPSRGHQTGHCWAGYYDPKSRRWHAAQDGRSGKTWWWFQLDRVAVYPYAATATRVREDGPQPFPWFFKHEVQGREVKKRMREGMPTRDIRGWMLTPCW